MKNKKSIIIITAGVLILLTTAPWMNKQAVHDRVFNEKAKIDGSINKKTGELICDYDVNWFPFGRIVSSCEGGYFVPFFYFKKGNNDNVQKQQIHENNKVETETADWKTYKNEKHGLEFKYPDNLTIEDNLKPYGCLFIREGAGLNVGWAYLELCAFYPDIYNSSIDFVKWIKDNSAEYDEAPDIYNFKIGGVDAVRVYHPKSPQTFSAYKINFLKDKRPYEIFLNDIDSKENTIIQNKIISTFKFKESLSVW